MTILSAQSIREARPVEPFHESFKVAGMTAGLSVAGYDVRIREAMTLERGGFALASTIERFVMPLEVIGIVHDKSTWARRGLACQNTVIEPGWQGFLTLELTNHGDGPLRIEAGIPIAQILFHWVDRVTEGYEGKYQNQANRPVPAIIETDEVPA